MVDAGLQSRARTKLDEIDARIGDLRTIRANLQTALDAGCDDLNVCATTDCTVRLSSTISRTTPARLSSESACSMTSA